jgi:hypothetical protein
MVSNKSIPNTTVVVEPKTKKKYKTKKEKEKKVAIQRVDCHRANHDWKGVV